MNETTELLQKALHRTKQEVAKVIIGHEPVVDQALVAIFNGAHALIEGVPGVAKTLLVRTLAHVMQCDFSRIQFTPDLMPTDITGTHVFTCRKTNSRWSKVRCLPPFYWRTRLTGHRPKPNRPYCRPCRSVP